MENPGKKSCLGHRKRLRERLLNNGIDSLLDYEIVELLLTLGTPRSDCKEQAKEVIKKFRGLKGVLEASVDELSEIKGIGHLNSFGIKLFQQLAERYLKEKIIGTEIKLKSSDEVYAYLFQSMQKEKEEIFQVIYLNNSNKIIDINEVFRGTVDQAVVYPRELVKNALKKNASRLIFVHNHPSGNLAPSTHDVEITNKLRSSCEAVDIEVLDHIIIGKDEYYSFREKNLLN